VNHPKDQNVRIKVICEAFCIFASQHTSHLRPWNITECFPPMVDVPAGNVMLSWFLSNRSSAACWPVCHCPSLIFLYIIFATLINLLNILPHQATTPFFIF